MDPQSAITFKNRGRVQFYRGQFELAASDLDKAQQLEPDLYTAIALYLARARGGLKDAALKLAADATKVKVEAWPAPVLALFEGEINPETLPEKAATPDSRAQQQRMCEANFYLGEWHLLRQERAEARILLGKAVAECPRDLFEYEGAVAELKRM